MYYMNEVYFCNIFMENNYIYIIFKLYFKKIKFYFKRVKIKVSFLLLIILK